MQRLADVARDTLPPEQRRFYDAVKAIRRRPVSGPFIVLMNSSPDLAARFAHLGHYFHSRGQADESILSMRVRGFVSLVGSRALNAPYEWGAWVNWALGGGVPQPTVDAVRESRPLPAPTAEEQLITDLCSQLVSGNHRVNDETFAAALAHFGAQGLVELVLTLGYFAMIALPLNAFEIEMSAQQNAQRKPFAPLAIIGTPWERTRAQRSNVPPLTPALSARAGLPLLAGHDDVAPEHQHFLDRIVRTRGGVAGVFQILLHSPDAAERVANVGAYVLYESMLEPAIKATVALVVARELDCAYVWQSALDLAGAAGVPEKFIVQIERGERPSALDAKQETLLDFCCQLLRANHHVSDSVYHATVDAFGVPLTVQIAATLGYFAMMSLVANAFEISPANPDPARPAL